MFTLLVFGLIVGVNSKPTLWDINQSPCGTNDVGYNYPSRSQSRIVGGSEAEPHSYPWMAVMRRSGRFTCGGSLIQGRKGYFILTAAHCTINTSPGVWQMRLGVHDRSQNEGTWQTLSVKTVINHESYGKPKLYDWDISLLELASDPIIDKYVKPGCVPVGNKNPGDTAVVTGWGATTEGGYVANKLQQVSKPILANNKCTSFLGSNSFSENNMLCAGFEQGGSDACQGDSGGPLMTKVDNQNKMEITGIVSWGYGCARPELPGVYSNTFASKAWINSHIN